MEYTKRIVASLLGVSLLVAPAFVSGQTVAELQAQIAALLAQINTLQSQLAALQGGSQQQAASCTFTRNLTIGSTGDDVRCLQNYLIAQGHSIPAGATGYFGNQTKAAVAAWQAANGVSPASGYFGPISRAKYSSLVAATPTTPTTPTIPTTPEPGITTPGAEGSITAKYAASPATGQDVYANSTGVAVAGVEIKATGSDVKVDRIDINFTSRPWLNISRIHVADGSTVLKTMDVTSSNTLEVTVGSLYTVRIDGLNVVVPKDTTKILTIQVDAFLQPGESTKPITYYIPANSVRGTDGKNIQQYAPTGQLSPRSFTVKTTTTASVELSESLDNPNKARNVLVSDTVTTEGVTALVFNVKAKNNGAYIRTIYASSTYPSGTVAKLYDGTTLVKSVTADSQTTFDDLSISVPKDATKTLTIRVDIPKITSGADDTTADASMSVPASAGGIVAEDATTFQSAAVSGSAVASGDSYFFTDAVPVLALSEVSITSKKGSGQNSNTYLADFKIKVNVTAQGGDIYVASINGVTATSNTGTVAINAQGFTSNATLTTNSNWRVVNGATNYFEVTGEIQNTSGSASTVASMVLNSFKWAKTDTAAYINQTWGLTDFKTGSVILQAKN